MQEIEKRRLGRTDIEVTPIGLGAMEFAGGKGFFKFMLGPVEPETQDDVVKVALDSGMNLIDTAEIYGSGYSERAVSRALQNAGKSPQLNGFHYLNGRSPSASLPRRVLND